MPGSPGTPAIDAMGPPDGPIQRQARSAYRAGEIVCTPTVAVVAATVSVRRTASLPIRLTITLPANSLPLPSPATARRSRRRRGRGKRARRRHGECAGRDLQLRHVVLGDRAVETDKI